MFTLFIFIAVLALLVISHEFGHFIVARKNGITVEEFGFGFPPRLIGIQRVKSDSGSHWEIIWRKKQLEETLSHHTGTLYSINLIPLGGFVRIKGENATESGAYERDSFSTKKTWQKALVLVAGVVMNIIVAAILLSVGYMVGMPSAGNDAVGKLQVMQVIADKPAATAGIVAGDAILKIGTLENPTVNQFQQYVNNHKNEELSVVIDHKGETIIKKIHPTIYADTGKAGIGVAIVSVGVVRYPWYRAIFEGCKSTWEYLVLILLGFWQLLSGLFRGAGVGGAVSGPVGVAVMTGEAARLGLGYLLQFAAMLSLNLAVLNILPIPALDGGRLLFVLIAKVFRRGVAPRVEQIFHSVGFVLLMTLVVVVTVHDIGAFKGAIVGWFTRVF
jgi:regulator of sigma E protease